MKWYLGGLKNYARFRGRARRREYWMFMLFNGIVSFVAGFFDGLLHTGYLISLIYALVVWIPTLAAGSRRLHDTGRSAWWLLLGLVPVVGLLLVVFHVLNGQAGENRYGPDPKLGAALG
ncbi:DUF805 domain-containing protein [Kitasatospora sp. NPDC018058]|uniref:DUF805 domain-containing protein n=1 Tax=Kitasatospora sp. NPDC018058 TaxID=3364025 RepID=UPI0037C0F8AE